MAEAGDILEVGAPIAIIGAEGEDLQQICWHGDAAAPKSAAQAEPEAQPRKRPPYLPKLSEAAPAQSAPIPPATGRQRTFTRRHQGQSGGAAHRTKKKALTSVRFHGSGPGGRIVKRDVEAIHTSRDSGDSRQRLAAPAAAPIGACPGVPDYERHTSTRSSPPAACGRPSRGAWWRASSKCRTSPSRWRWTRANCYALRKQINDKLDDEHKVTVNDMIVKAAALTLRQYPNLNTHFHGENVVRYDQINIGIAVALPRGRPD